MGISDFSAIHYSDETQALMKIGFKFWEGPTYLLKLRVSSEIGISIKAQ